MKTIKELAVEAEHAMKALQTEAYATMNDDKGIEMRSIIYQTTGIVCEIKQYIHGGYFSQEYINEKTSKIQSYTKKVYA